MSEQEVNQRPSVIHIRFYNDPAVDVANEIDLPVKVFNEELQKRYEKEKAEELDARLNAGLEPFAERHLFTQDHPTGVPNVCMVDLVKEILDEGYFLIAGDHEVDDLGRNRARLVFSCNPNDIGYWHATPTRSRMIECFETRVFMHGHFHDRRRIHPGTGRQVGNNVIDLVRLHQPSSCKKYKMMHFHNHGEVSDGPYSYDVRTRDTAKNAQSQGLTFKLKDVAE
jgi:hypothetical protein